MRPRVVMVAALAKNRVIGREGLLPWYLPDDLKHFKALTVGKPVIMGRKTYDSIGRPLPNRLNVVMTRRGGAIEARAIEARAIEGCEVVPSVEAALAACGEAPEIAIIGGGTIYEAFLPRADVLELTLVEAEVEGDARFPSWEEDFVEVSRVEHPADPKHAHAFAFTRWERRQ